MGHLTSRHTLTVNLANSKPTAQAAAFTQMHAIQGPTNVKFLVDNIDLGTVGIYGFTLDYGDGSEIVNIEPTFTNNLPTTLPISALEHTYYQTSTTASELTARATINYLSHDGIAPLSAVHDIVIKQSAENMIEKNLEIVNSQLFTIAGSATPIFNIESSDNIVYPCSFIEIEAPTLFDDNIYINTDPETDIDLSATYLYNSKIALTQDINSASLSALSGSGFTIQGKSGKKYTMAFAYLDQPLRYAYTQDTNNTLLSAEVPVPISIQNIQNSITETFKHLIGTEFSTITKESSAVLFYQSNQLPPEATTYTYTTTVSSTDPTLADQIIAFSIEDKTYSYTTNIHGPAGLTGLSAVNRVRSNYTINGVVYNANEVLIRAL